MPVLPPSSSPSSSSFLLLPFFLLLLLTTAAAATSSSSSSCPSLPPSQEPCTSVWNMKPSQVDVVMALGDSITAAFGANGRKGGLHEDRGTSWSIGGDANTTTLPNFIKQYNPAVTGYSIGRREASLCWGPVCREVHRKRHDVLNAALSGSMVRNVWFDEMDYLEQEMLELGIDVENAWKVLTLFIGANDVCVACHMEKRFDPEEFGDYYRRIIQQIQDRIPRVFVNVVELFNVSAIYRATENVAYCNDVHRLFFIECDCAFGPESITKPFRERMDELSGLYNRQIRQIVREFSQVKNDTFAIALHPFTRDLNITSFPMNMISNLDCFHPSAESHALTATALWNSMLTPPQARLTNVPSLKLQAVCPGEGSVFYPGYRLEEGEEEGEGVVMEEDGEEGGEEGIMMEGLEKEKTFLRTAI